jgi:sphingolipid 4-desaturase/C4-monooxygenase
MELDYIKIESPNVHVQRAREMLQKYPEIRNLYGNHYPSALIVIAIVSLQFLAAYWLRESSFFLIIFFAYVFGAFCNHALYVFMHEATHNSILKSRTGNKVMGIICDFPLVLPGALAFRKYHIIHHRHLNEHEMDPDMVGHEEGKSVGHSPVKKLLWIFFFSLSQALRPLRLKKVKMWNAWIVVNLVVQVSVMLATFYFFGAKSIIYLLLSTFFALGLHPLGGRWIQEHYIVGKTNQETYSYYGPLNKVIFNVGYHNEHHDFFNIPWTLLPKLKSIAPEYYDSLDSYKSYSQLLFDFIFKKEYSAFSRLERVRSGAKT